MKELPYREIPPAPLALAPGAVLARLVDGLAFRYRWATEGLRSEDLTWQATPENMSIGDMLRHIYGLVYWVCESLGVADQAPAPSKGAVSLELRRYTLEATQRLRNAFAEMGEEALGLVRINARDSAKPFWNIINGPLCDALTHVGQINAWRRIMGNPAPRADVFMGLPPGD